MAITFPLTLQGALWSDQRGRCGVCGAPIETAVYLNAGSIADNSKSTIVDQEVFWNCGVHKKGSGSYDLEIVRAHDQDQFDLSFCSTKCLRDFFMAIVNCIEGHVRSVNGSDC
jgi:hypothetical protein